MQCLFALLRASYMFRDHASPECTEGMLQEVSSISPAVLGVTIEGEPQHTPRLQSSVSAAVLLQAAEACGALWQEPLQMPWVVAIHTSVWSYGWWLLGAPTLGLSSLHIIIIQCAKATLCWSALWLESVDS